jgi:hypothetical protein
LHKSAPANLHKLLHKFGHPDTLLTLDFLYTDPSLTTGSSVLWESLSDVASTRNRDPISGELPPSASTDLELIDYSLMQPSAMELSSSFRRYFRGLYLTVLRCWPRKSSTESPIAWKLTSTATASIVVVGDVHGQFIFFFHSTVYVFV